MRFEQRDLGDDAELDMSPMIDMVFLLLIFFIVASQIVDEKPQVEIPVAAYSKVPDDIKGRVLISVDKDDNFYLELNQTPVSIEDIKAYLASELERNPKMKVMIRADGDVRYETNEKVTIACAEVGAQDLIYAAFEE